MLKWVLWDMAAALLSYEGLQLLDPRLLRLDARLCLQGDPVVRIKFLLQLNDCLISFVQTTGQGNHDVSLFEQELFISVNLSLSFFDLGPLTLYLVQLCLIFLPDALLLLFERRPELRRVFNLLASRQNLRVHCFDFLFKKPLLFLRLQELV